MAPPEEVPHAFVHVPIDGPIGRDSGSEVEVIAPTAYGLTQLAAYFRPRRLVPRSKHIPDGLLDPPDALLRRRRRQLGVASLAVFGSVARDEAGPETDVALFVEFRGAATLARFMDSKSLLETSLWDD